MAEIPGLDYIFHPNSVAVVGVSNDPTNMGYMFLASFHSSGFKGSIYPVHPREKEVLGLKCYPNIRDIPEPVDYAFVAIPARSTPQFIEDCASKGVKAVCFFTAGFGESEEADGQRLEAEVVQIAQRGGVRIIGPNCLGIYCPSSSLSFSVDLPQQSGPLGLLCQSGGNTAYLIRAFTTRGVYLSKAVSYGNAADINETELLDYFIHDSETKIISAYIEGAKNGKQFFKVLKEAARSKPVIILKGGKTESGAATAASHTGALASSASTWDALIEQANAIQVDSLEEMVDMACLFAYMPPPRGKRMGVVGLGGGASVLSADSCAKAGLSLPTLPEEIRQKLRNLTTGAGNIFRNPVDTQSLFIGEKQFAETVKIVGGWEQIDILLLHIAYDEMAGSIQLVRDLGMFRFMLQTGINAAKETGKPVAVALHYTALSETFKSMCEGREICWKAGLPVFYSMSGAANAISKFLRYHESKAQIG